MSAAVCSSALGIMLQIHGLKQLHKACVSNSCGLASKGPRSNHIITSLPNICTKVGLTCIELSTHKSWLQIGQKDC